MLLKSSSYSKRMLLLLLISSALLITTPIGLFIRRWKLIGNPKPSDASRQVATELSLVYEVSADCKLIWGSDYNLTSLWLPVFCLYRNPTMSLIFCLIMSFSYYKILSRRCLPLCSYLFFEINFSFNFAASTSQNIYIFTRSLDNVKSKRGYRPTVRQLPG
jgi:hypothetical protein